MRDLGADGGIRTHTSPEVATDGRITPHPSEGERTSLMPRQHIEISFTPYNKKWMKKGDMHFFRLSVVLTFPYWLKLKIFLTPFEVG
jgi:hypothetical protein